METIFLEQGANVAFTYVSSEQEGKDIWHKNVLNWLGIKEEDFII